MQINHSEIPTHVAIVMDGNGRWANARGKTRVQGHQVGEETLFQIVEEAIRLGVKYLSVYAFSTENWKRSPEEVRFLMGYMKQVLRKRRDQFDEFGVRIVWSGQQKRLWSSVVKKLREAEQRTAKNKVLTLVVCGNYGGRAELVDAMRLIAQEVAEGTLQPEKITEKTVRRSLYCPEIPDVDLFIRTSGEQRMSNFLLWQSAYAELVFLERLWPDFTPQDFNEAVQLYAKRNRRFGSALDAPEPPKTL